MKIHLISDIHLENGWVYQPPEDLDCEVVIVAGDLHHDTEGIVWIERYFPGKQVIYIAGNHEFYRGNLGTYKNIKKVTKSISNIHFLENTSIVIDGVRFLGCTLWSDFEINGNAPLSMLYARDRMNDYRIIEKAPSKKSENTPNWSARLEPQDTIDMHNVSRAFLEKELAKSEYPTVVVTHHAPSEQGLNRVRYRDNRLDGAYGSNLEDMMHAHSPMLWVHGHTHVAREYQIGTTRVVSNSRGYGNEVSEGFDPGLILNI